MDEREARDFIAKHEPLVRSIAVRTRNELRLKVELDDLMGYGFQGLLQAHERFDPERGARFTSFAYYRVRGAILDGVRKMARLPRRVHAARKAAEAFDMLAEGAAEARARAAEAPDIGATLSAMDDLLGKYSAAFLITALGQDASATSAPDELAIAGQERERVTAAVASLPERERTVVTKYYFEDQTLEEIGAALNLSKSWCSRLHSRALGLLRDVLTPPG